MADTGIEWTQRTWNPIAGCSKVSAGCKNCYAMTMAKRLASMPATREKYGPTVDADGQWTGVTTFDEHALLEPIRRKKPTTWFVNSMSDLFHGNVTDEQIDRIFEIMAVTPHHSYQVLTKRPERMLAYTGDFGTRVIIPCALPLADWHRDALLRAKRETEANT